jgi:aryl-phospho-beta-D-glucosidase BglC (GH1 family)
VVSATTNEHCRIFWNFKTEGSPEWDAFALIDNGIFPQPLTSRKFAQICTN